MNVTNPVLFLDTETTGLDTDRCGIIQFGAVLVDPWYGNEEFELECNPFLSYTHTHEYDIEVSPYALEVNGLNLNRIKNLDYTTDHLMWFLQNKFQNYKGLSVSGWNVSGYDIPMLKSAAQRAGFEYPFHYHVADLMNMAKCLQLMGKLPGLTRMGLQPVCQYLGIDTSQFGRAHTALADVKATMAVYDAFDEMFHYQRGSI